MPGSRATARHSSQTTPMPAMNETALPRKNARQPVQAEHVRDGEPSRGGKDLQQIRIAFDAALERVVDEAFAF